MQVIVSWLIVFGVVFTIFFLLFIRGASKLNREYDKVMENFKHD